MHRVVSHCFAFAHIQQCTLTMSIQISPFRSCLIRPSYIFAMAYYTRRNFSFTYHPMIEVVNMCR